MSSEAEKMREMAVRAIENTLRGGDCEHNHGTSGPDAGCGQRDGCTCDDWNEPLLAAQAKVAALPLPSAPDKTAEAARDVRENVKTALILLSPGNRTLDEMMADMGAAYDRCRAALAALDAINGGA